MIFPRRGGAESKGTTLSRERMKLPKRSKKGADDGLASLKGRRFVSERN